MIHLDLRQPLERTLLPRGVDVRHVLAGGVRDPLCLAAAGFLLLLVAYALLLDRRLEGREAEVQRELARAAEAADGLREARTRAEGLRREREGLEQRRLLIDRLEADRYALVRLMADVAARLPEGAWIDVLETTAVNAETGSVEFRLAGYSPSAERTGAFEQALLGEGAVVDVRLAGSESVEVDGLTVTRFELRGRAGGRSADPGYAVEDVLALVLADGDP